MISQQIDGKYMSLIDHWHRSKKYLNRLQTNFLFPLYFIPDYCLVSSVKRENYEKAIHDLLSKAILLDHSKSPCEEDFIPNTKGKVYVMFVKMDNHQDYESWLQIAKCFKIWDLDARGYHKSMWRFFLKSNHVLVVGVPNSPYSWVFLPDFMINASGIAKLRDFLSYFFRAFKPAKVTPIFMEDKMANQVKRWTLTEIPLKK